MTVSELIAKLIYNLLKRLDFSGGVQVVIDEGIAGERKDFGNCVAEHIELVFGCRCELDFLVLKLFGGLQNVHAVVGYALKVAYCF